MDSENETIVKSQCKLPADQKHARDFLGFWTVIYVIYLALIVFDLFERVIRIMLWYSLYPLTGFGVLILEIFMPLVVIYSIRKMWSLYRKRNYAKAYWATTYPVALILVTSCIRAFIS